MRGTRFLSSEDKKPQCPQLHWVLLSALSPLLAWVLLCLITFKASGSVSFKSLHQTPVWPHKVEWAPSSLQFLLKPESRAFSASVSRASCTCVQAGMGSGVKLGVSTSQSQGPKAHHSQALLPVPKATQIVDSGSAFCMWGKPTPTHKSEVLLTGPSGIMTQDVLANSSAFNLQWHR